MSEPKLYALSPQFDDGRCQFCGEQETRDRPLVSILTNINWKERHFVHPGECHDKHSSRCKAEREQRQRERAA